MSRFSTLAGAISLSMAVGGAFAADLHVPGEYPTIQAAMDAAVDHDRVIVQSGTYAEAVDFLGKQVELIGRDGREETTIDATSLNTSVVTMSGGPTVASTLRGFTITGGTGTMTADGRVGGGVFIDGCSPLVQDCRFVGNVADFGGGLFVRDLSYRMRIMGCEFTNNQADYGGGLSARNLTSLLTVSDCQFLGNSAIEIGGGAEVLETSSSVNFDRCEFRNNTAGGGGGLWVGQCRNTLDVSDCTFEYNTADGAGGRISLNGGGLTIYEVDYAEVTDCRFEANIALGGSGGGLYTTSGGYELDILGCVFHRNTAERDGGGAAVNLRGDTTVSGSTFTFNNATNGAGLYAWHTNRISSCSFERNVADNRGGGAYVYVGDVRGSSFRFNHAAAGGGLSLSSGNLDTSSLLQNIAVQGGGLFVSGGSPVIRNCLIAQNQASVGGGMHGPGMVRFTTISDNVADSGGAIFVDRESVRSWSSIFWGNTPDEIASTENAEVVVEASVVAGGFAGWGNVDVDPLFVDPVNDNYALQDGSPAIDGGIYSIGGYGLNGNPRYVGAFADMGAFENQNSVRVLTVRQPNNGSAGQLNMFYIGGAPANGNVYLVFGLREGVTPVPGCSGLSMDLQRPRIVSGFRADEWGFIAGEVFVPIEASGRRVLFQVVDRNSCEVSNRIETVFE